MQMNRVTNYLFLTSAFFWCCNHASSTHDVISIFENNEFTQLHEMIIGNKAMLINSNNDSSIVSIDLESKIAPEIKELIVELNVKEVVIYSESNRLTYVFFQDWESFQFIEYVPSDSSYFAKGISEDNYEIRDLGNHFYYHAMY